MRHSLVLFAILLGCCSAVRTHSSGEFVGSIADRFRRPRRGFGKRRRLRKHLKRRRSEDRQLF